MCFIVSQMKIAGPLYSMIIFFSWGLNLDTSKDKYRFEVPATKKNQDVEYFSMIFQHTENGADLIMAWDVVEVRLPIQYTEK